MNIILLIILFIIFILLLPVIILVVLYFWLTRKMPDLNRLFKQTIKNTTKKASSTKPSKESKNSEVEDAEFREV